MKNVFIICFTILLNTAPSFATHIAGGEISYQYMSADTYLIRLTLYRDCYNGVPPFDDPASVGIFDSANQLLNTIHVSLLATVPINNSSFNCTIGNACYEKGEYVFKAYLPRRAGGYQIAYQRCCRPAGIVNVSNIAVTGMTCLVSIPDSLFAIDASPIYNNDPFTIECKNTLFTYDNSAFDSDGDSIVYSLYTPFEGASNTTPLPDPPFNPPYNTITWGAGYFISNIFGSGSSLSIDSITGLLSGTASDVGIYVYGVCAKEFRNGVYIGETKRDFQVDIVLSTGINETNIDKPVLIFPNPVHQSAIIKLEGLIDRKNSQVVFYNALGCKIKSISVGKSEIVFERDNLPAGIYFYRVVCDSGVMDSGKVVIE